MTLTRKKTNPCKVGVTRKITESTKTLLVM